MIVFKKYVTLMRNPQKEHLSKSQLNFYYITKHNINNFNDQH